MDTEKRSFRLGAEEDKILQALSEKLGKSLTYVVNLAIHMINDVDEGNYVFCELGENVKKDLGGWMDDHPDLTEEEIINDAIHWYMHDPLRKYLLAEKIEQSRQNYVGFSSGLEDEQI